MHCKKKANILKYKKNIQGEIVMKKTKWIFQQFIMWKVQQLKEPDI